jgi:hypothetical protein
MTGMEHPFGYDAEEEIKPSTHLDDRGVVRQDHYGAGVQPWDTIVNEGWAPEYAAGNILKYLRRTKAPVHSLESARWFYARLGELSRGELVSVQWSKESQRSYARGRASAMLVRLKELLTSEEFLRLKELD